MSFLKEVLKEKKRLIKDLKGKTPLREIKKMIHETTKRSFSKTFSQRFHGEVKIIAEVKKASPSKGILISNLNLPGLIVDYERGGASAISIITEEKHFLGSLDWIAKAKRVTGLPILRKDFLVDEYEIFQSKAAGADAILLIGETLDRPQAEDYLSIAGEVGLDVLFEVHSLKAYEEIADLQGFILGINNRNLETLKIDLSTAHEVLDGIPADCPVVVESGIEKKEQVEEFAKRGVSGFLVGTSLMLSKSPRERLEVLRGKR